MTQQKEKPNAPLPFVANVPRLHLMIATVAVTVVFLALLLPSEPVQANRTTMPLPLELAPIAIAPMASRLDLPTSDAVAEPANAAAAPTEPEVFDAAWKEITVRSGDSLAKLFQRAGLSASELHEVMQAGPEAKSLTRLFPGQKLAFQLDDDGELQSLRYEEDLLTSTEYVRADDSFIAEKVVREPEVRQQFARGSIDSSLYKAAADAGLPDGTILEIANIFGGVVDFILDIRAGDEFAVLYEEKWLDGQKVGNGAVLAATFINQGRAHTAYRYDDTTGSSSYYSPEGVSMRRAFLRAPLDFLRVTSNFNPKRMHPVLKITRPHRGVDYGAPTGTPVYAAGDGRVAQSGFTRPNGNFVVVQHGQQYTTKYLHLQKRAVSAGARVKQGQLIGWVGSTGYATGPHLHYEFLVNGVHRDPRKIVDQLPRATQLASAERKRFDAQTSTVRTQFAARQTEYKLAAANPRDEKTQASTGTL